jgi:hypothetical protein
MRTVATALVCLALLVGATAGVRADCPPAAVPIGDPALVSSVAERLSASGIATTPRAGCPVCAWSTRTSAMASATCKTSRRRPR